MLKNIEIQINTGSNTYETLYPKTLGSLVDGTVANATNAVNATNATSASSASTLSSTLSVSKGGTGVTSLSTLASNLEIYLKPIKKTSGSYVGTSSLPSSYTHFIYADYMTLLTFSGYNAIPNLLLIFCEYDNITGVFAKKYDDDERYSICYALKPATNEGKNFISWQLNSDYRPRYVAGGYATRANSNQIYIGAAQSATASGQYMNSSLTLSNSGSNYNWLGFYF